MPQPREIGKTLFVRNLPYTTSDAELEKVFGHYGQVKSCFTVKEKGVLDRCRGFGYITYSLREDAEKAKDAVKVFGGRPILLTYADRKPTKKARRQQQLQKKEDKEESDAGSRESEEEMNESKDSDSEDYEKLTSKSNAVKSKAKKLRKKKSERADAHYDTGRVVVVTGLSAQEKEKQIRARCSPYGTIKRLEYPVPGRDGPTALITYELHKQARVAVEKINGSSRGGDVLHASLLSKEGKAPSKKTLQKSRLIVRNLSFKVNLLYDCSEEDVHKVFSPFGEVVEVHIPKKPDGRMFGYAFVQFKSFFEALKAISAINDSKVKGRPVTVDWVVPRDKYKEMVSSKTGGEAGRDNSNQESDTGEDGKEEEQQEGEDICNDSDNEGDSEDAESAGEDEESAGEDEESAASSDDSSDDEEEEETLLKEDAKDGKTLFIRNVPCDADEDELRAVFQQFGPVRYCRAVLDPVSGSCRGSAFVQFRNVFSVQPCLETSWSDEKGVWFDGSRLDVTVALSRNELQKLGETRAKYADEKERDKRNLYLAREGVIVPNSDAAADLSKTELAKRAKSFSVRKSKLQNPYFFVSKTRLSVRELPVTADEKQLKQIFLKSAGEGAKIKQVKLMRSKERFTGDGLGRSMGYGFLEFAEHSSALAALRAVNNNPEIFGPRRRPIVEFALEDSRVLKRREQKKQKQSLAGSKESHLVDDLMEQEDRRKDEIGQGKGGKKLSKRVGWQLKWKERRLKQKDQKKKLRDKQTGSPRQAIVHGTTSRGKQGNKHSVRSKKYNGSSRQFEQEKNPSHGLKRKGVSRDSELVKRPRKRPKASAESREEKDFSAMVKNYKAKLFSRTEDTRWFE